MTRRIWRQAIIIAAAGAILLAAGGCVPTRSDQLQDRLEQFRKLLPETARREFDAQRYEAAVFAIDSALATDPAFAGRWEEMKKTEAIGLFSTTEIVHYFVVYFVSYRGER